MAYGVVCIGVGGVAISDGNIGLFCIARLAIQCPRCASRNAIWLYGFGAFLGGVVVCEVTRGELLCFRELLLRDGASLSEIMYVFSYCWVSGVARIRASSSSQGMQILEITRPSFVYANGLEWLLQIGFSHRSQKMFVSIPQ